MKKSLLFLLTIFFFKNIFCQSIDSTLIKYANDFGQEKAYLHFDKAVYYAGETIWFKAYLIEDLFPLEGSKNLYIDFIANDGTVLNHTVSPIINGATNGQFEISTDYKFDLIHVRAYTKWMLNFDTSFLYNKNIRILNSSKSGLQKAPAIIPSLHFFAEGGEAIAGIGNRIAFKATDQWGKPVKIKGIVQDSKAVFVDSLSVTHDGMGSIYFIPKEGNSYTAKWKDEKGTIYTTNLPALKSNGLSMQVSTNGTKRIININSSTTLTENLKQVHLVGTVNQRMVFQTDIPITEGTNTRRLIPTEQLPSGILTLTLFDADWNAIAERITFVNNNDHSFKTTMNVLHWGLGKRKKNEIEIILPDSLEGANLSISVTDASIENDNSENIISQFLLSSDIKGKVYNPAYYFSSNDDEIAKHLDLVMLTNGWRRFKWEEVTKGKSPKINYPKDTNYLNLSGQLFGIAKSQLTGKESIALLLQEKDSATKMLILPVEKNGSFEDARLIFFDTVTIYYSLKSKLFSLAEAKFMTNRLPAPNYSTFSKNFLYHKSLADTTGTAYHSYLAAENLRLLQSQKSKMMETVIIKTKQKAPIDLLEEKYPSGLFKGSGDYRFDMINDPSSSAYNNIFNYLQGRIAGLQVNTNGGTASLSWRGSTPQLYLDEMETDASLISTISVADIAYIKVFRPPFFGSFGGGAGGAIVVYTRRGNDGKRSSNGMSVNKVFSYSPIRQFYSPNYEKFDSKNEEPDVRTTLYWNPLLITNQKTNSIKLMFYNNDVSKAFRVVIQGMSSNGLLTHFEEIME